MEAKQCLNGHYYDSQKYTSCPYCNEKSIGKTMPLEEAKSAPGSAAFDPIPPTEPISEEPNNRPKPSPIPKPSGDNHSKQTGNHVTKPIDEAKMGFHPTVGWVICIRGPHKGQDFRLRTGYNKVGRSHEMAISMPNDEQITRDSHAIIAYEPHHKKFFAAGDKNMIYINGVFVMGMQELHANDIIGIGASELMFVPLCGDVFTWD